MGLLLFRSDDEIPPLSPLSVSLTAGFSGSVAAAASHAFDTAKCRSQCTVLPKVCYLSSANSNLPWLCYTIPGSKHTNFFDLLQTYMPTYLEKNA